MLTRPEERRALAAELPPDHLDLLAEAFLAGTSEYRASDVLGLDIFAGGLAGGLSGDGWRMLVTRQMLDVFQRRESLGLAAMLAQVLHATVAMLAAAREESIDMAAAALLNEVRGRGASLPAALAAELDGLAAPANAVAVPMPDLPPAVGDAVVAALKEL